MTGAGADLHMQQQGSLCPQASFSWEETQITQNQSKAWPELLISQQGPGPNNLQQS